LTSEQQDRPKWDELRGRIDALHRPGSPTSSTEAAGQSPLQRTILSPIGLFLFWVPLALVLIWAVFAKSYVAYLADANPALAVRMSSANPAAFLNLAQAEMKRIAEAPASPVPGKDAPAAEDDDADIISRLSGEPEDRARLNTWARTALSGDPLNARAFRILGQVSASESNDKLTGSFMEAASRRSLRESAAIYWMMLKAYEARDYRTAIHLADILMRTRPNSARYVVPVLGKIAETENDGGELQRLLAANPPWRREFLDRLPANITDARTPLKIMLGLKDSSVPPSADDLKRYLNFLTSKGFHELAYYAWLQFLPPEQLGKVGLLYNGDFEATPSGLPFDWRFKEGANVSIKIDQRSSKEDGRALVLDFGAGRVSELGVTQLVTLPPGQYRFEGRTNMDVVSQRGLQWRITCANKAKTRIAESPVARGFSKDWESFAFAFTVPDDDCRAQYVELAFDARWASEQFISGTIWYDDLGIVQDQPSQIE